MTAILLSLLGSGGSASPEVFVSGVGASAQVGFSNAQGGETLGVQGVSSSAAIGLVTVNATVSVDVNVSGVSAMGQVGPVVEEGLPAGAILFFDRSSTDTAIPSGWNLYTEYNGDSIVNFLIKGGTSSSRNTGSPAPVSISSTNPITSSTSGAHSYPNIPSPTGTITTFPRTGLPGTIVTYTAPAGGHSHDVTLTGSATYPSSATFQGTSVPLIKLSSPSAAIPSGALVFSASSVGFSGFTRKSWGTSNGVYAASSSINVENALPTNVAPSFGISTSSSGAHNHAVPTTFSSFTPPAVQRDDLSAPANHTHNLGVFGHTGVWKQFKHLKPFVASSDATVQPGMIIMLEGSSAPSGWNICDGTNGTPDMVDYFIGFNNSEDSSDVLVGRDVIGSTGPTATTPAPPPSAYASTSIPVTLAINPWNHSHINPASPSSSLGGPSPFTTGLHKESPIPHTHTVPNATVTMPNAYTPQHLTLIFIQKT